MKHSFDINVAEKYGIEIAIMFDMFCFWISKNEANGTNYHDGKYWTFNSRKGMQKIFPYLNDTKIKRTIQKMVDYDLLVKGNYNDNPWNQTCWYAFGENGKILKNALSVDWVKMTNALGQNAQCTMGQNDQCTMGQNDQCKTVIYTFNNTVSKENKKECSDNAGSPVSETIPYEEIINYMNEKCEKNYKKNSKVAKEKIRARWNEGFSLDDFKTVIDIKSKEWLNDQTMCKYLRPDTLFGSKFEIYLNSSLPKQNEFVIRKGVKM